MAEAGPHQAVGLGDQVMLDGSSSTDPDEEDVPDLTYAWSAAEDNPVPVLLSEDPVRPRFEASLAGVYWFRLEVSDGELSSTDSVMVTVAGSGNKPPIAEAGPAELRATSNQIILDGSGSTDPDAADVPDLTYLWEAVSAPEPVEFVDPSARETSFTALASGMYTVRLTVSDGELSASDVVRIEVPPSVVDTNLPPVADAGPDRQVQVGTPVILSGSASSDPDGEDTELTFQWSLGNSPITVVLSDPTGVQPTFTPPEPGDYVFGLVVHDGQAPSVQAVVTITALSQAFEELLGMIQIPAGSFAMGADNGLHDEDPEHQVEMSTYWIDKYEVTTAQYLACVDDGECDEAGTLGKCNAGNAGRSDHPINCVNWEQARAYCEHAEKRLPTEAEWEKAARGTDGRRFPWGDTPTPHMGLLNYDGNEGKTVPVGSHPDGASFYGAHDMSGNVMEWTADRYWRDYYQHRIDNDLLTDPPGPEESVVPEDYKRFRAARGSSFRTGTGDQALTTTVRIAQSAVAGAEEIGFRCARTSPPEP